MSSRIQHDGDGVRTNRIGKTYTIGTSSSGESVSEDSKFSSDNSYAPEATDGLIPRFVSDLFHAQTLYKVEKLTSPYRSLRSTTRIKDLLNPHENSENRRKRTLKRGAGDGSESTQSFVHKRCVESIE